MGRFGMTLVALALCSSAQARAPSEPKPTPVSDVTIARSWALSQRSAFTQQLLCVEVPVELFHKDRALFPDGLPPGSRIAGAGRVLGVLAPTADEGFQLTLIRAGKMVSELFLRPPSTRAFVTRPTLSLGENGEYAALRDREGFAVYAGGALTGVFASDTTHSSAIAFGPGAVYWAPWPRGSALKLAAARRPGKPLFMAGQEPPLWLRAELDGAGEEVLLRVDSKRVNAESPILFDQAVGMARRSDGRFWLVGLCSGEIMLTSKTERVVRRWLLPYRLTTEEDDPDLASKLEKENREWMERSSPASGDATRKPAKSAKVLMTGRMRIFMDVFARDRDLVLTTATLDPSNALLLINDADERACCLQFPPEFRGGDGFLNVASTRDELWFFAPFGYFLWEDLDRLVAAAYERREEPEEHQTQTALPRRP